MISDRRLKIGIIGCGTIGSRLAQAIEKNFRDKAKLIAICDILPEKTNALEHSLRDDVAVLSMDALIGRSDLVIETASVEAASEVATKALTLGKSVMIMSTGGLLGREEELLSLAEKNSSCLYLPSGAILGLDGVKAASFGRIKKVTLTTRKPPQGLKGAPYLIKKKIDLNRIKEETVIFEGKVKEAIEGFPKNINVSATLALAGVGIDNTYVKVVTSPDYTLNIHELVVEGDFGKLSVRCENLPSPENPKTSLLAVLSGLATLKGILGCVKIGT